MNSIEILMLENQIALMDSMIGIKELSTYRKEKLEKQIKKSLKLLALFKE